MTIREEIIKKVRHILEGDIPEEFYCDNCGLLIVDEDTAHRVEEEFGGYCDICECKEPKSCRYNN